MEPKIKPAFQTQEYYPQDVVRIKDRYQQFCWLRENVYPLDMYESDGDVIMIFPKNEKTRELYRRWRNREL
jgi:hypothetical protein